MPQKGLTNRGPLQKSDFSDHFAPGHRAKKTKAFVETLGDKLRLFFLPPYSPDRNPDELVWKHLKADTLGRMAVTGKTDFKSNARFVRLCAACKTTPEKSVRSIRSSLSNTPHETLTYSLINNTVLLRRLTLAVCSIQATWTLVLHGPRSRLRPASPIHYRSTDRS